MNKELYYIYLVLKKVYVEKAYAGIELNKVIKLHKNEINTGLITKIVYGVIENDIYLDYVISKFVSKKPDESINIILKIGAFSKENINSIPPFALVNELVNLTKKYENKFAGGFVNATLKNILKTPVQLPDKDKNIVEYLSIKYSYPVWLVRELIKDYKEEITEELLAKKLTTLTHIRVLEDKITIEDFKKYLKDKDIEFEKSAMANTFYVDYEKLLDYKELQNYYIVQGLPSIITANNLCVNQAVNILDLCSAPGGKSVLIAQNNPYANIVSADIYAHRIKRVEEYANRYGIKNIKTVLNDASKFKSEWVDKFDYVLCDVPCSNTGVVGKKPDVLLNRREENLKELSKLQYKILSNASKYVKKDGILVYSTCSILKDENINVIDKFLEENKDFKAVNVETFGVKVIEDNKTALFLPNISETEGFFIGRLKRND